MDSARYSSVAVVLHWAIAILILCQIAGGFYMHNLPNTSPLKFDLYQLHKSFGLSILVLSLVRLGWRLGHRPPALPSAMAAWEKLAARAAHWGFYVLMIAAPLVGWAIVSVSPTDIPTKYFGFIPIPHLPLARGESAEEFFEEVHELLAYGILGLLALHVGAALKHRFFNKDHVFQSMSPSRFAQWAGVGGVIGALMMGAALYGLAPPLNANSGAAGVRAGAGETNWQVAYDQSTLKFIGEEKGRRFEGEFRNFHAEIIFFPDDLAASSIEVAVSTGSAATGDELRNTILPGEEWFDVKAHPEATFTSGSIRQTGDGAYEADGVLTIKGFEKDITLAFTLENDGDRAVAIGGADLIRTQFGLGTAASWLEEEEVQLGVRVEFEVHATRAD